MFRFLLAAYLAALCSVSFANNETFGLGGPTVTVSAVTTAETFGLSDSVRVAAATIPASADEWVWVNEQVCVNGVCRVMPRLVRRTANAARVVASSVATPVRVQVASYATPAPVYQATTTRQVYWETSDGSYLVEDVLPDQRTGPLRRLLDRFQQRRFLIRSWRGW